MVNRIYSNGSIIIFKRFDSQLRYIEVKNRYLTNLLFPVYRTESFDDDDFSQLIGSSYNTSAAVEK